ncbi:MAG TPA: hypothetical protein VKE74_18005 [Gemmataceae bacterium]|nr:hypothetical protein [Gemmataceae bacterium]
MNEPTTPPEPQTEPPTSFKSIIIAGAVVWLLGAAIIVLSLL